jgi:hypothetical protein
MSGQSRRRSSYSGVQRGTTTRTPRVPEPARMISSRRASERTHCLDKLEKTPEEAPG